MPWWFAKIAAKMQQSGAQHQIFVLLDLPGATLAFSWSLKDAYEKCEIAKVLNAFFNLNVKLKLNPSNEKTEIIPTVRWRII